MADDTKKEVNLSKKVQDLLDTISKLTLVEAAELVEGMEDKFGITAAAPAAVAVAGAAPAVEEEEKDFFNIKLNGFAEGTKIKVIKALRSIKDGLGLKEAKDLVEGGGIIAEDVKKEDAENMIKVLKEAGGDVVME